MIVLKHSSLKTYSCLDIEEKIKIRSRPSYCGSILNLIKWRISEYMIYKHSQKDDTHENVNLSESEIIELCQMSFSFVFEKVLCDI